MPDPQLHALYRFYSDTGQLLYVGITSNPGNRFPQHEKDKPWSHEVRGVSIEQYPARESVLQAETRAIQIENPLYSKQRPPLPTNPVAGGGIAPRPLVWICDVCKKPIADDDGHLWVNLNDAEDARDGERDWRERYAGTGVSLSELAQLPDPAPWQRHHRACDPEPGALAYDIGGERVRTHAALLSWTAHLSEKAWLPFTNWSQMIRAMAEIDV